MAVIPKLVFYDIVCAKFKLRTYDTDTQQFSDQEIPGTDVKAHMDSIDVAQPSDGWQCGPKEGTTLLTFEKIPAPV